MVGVLGQLLLTASLRYGKVSTVIVMDYTGLVWSALLGWLVWDYLPGIAMLLAAPLIVSAGIIMVTVPFGLACAVFALLL